MKKAKSFLLSLLLFISGVSVANDGGPSNGSDEPLQIPFLPECEHSVSVNGPLIYVTVCGRRSTLVGMGLGFSCETPSASECTFTNHTIPMED